MTLRDPQRFKSNGSLECRNCHSEKSMDFIRQSPRAAKAHERFLVSCEKTCIDCYKGIAHHLPGVKPSAMIEPASTTGDHGPMIQVAKDRVAAE
ncbi:MAG: NapC/NirT family cytochrome c [Geminicoccales bacterium]